MRTAIGRGDRAYRVMRRTTVKRSLAPHTTGIGSPGQSACARMTASSRRRPRGPPSRPVDASRVTCRMSRVRAPHDAPGSPRSSANLRSPGVRYSPAMPNSSLRTLLCAFSCLLAIGAAQAQSSSATSPIADAISAAERGQPVDAARFANDPLYGWLEYAALRRDIDTLPSDQAQSFRRATRAKPSPRPSARSGWPRSRGARTGRRSAPRGRRRSRTPPCAAPSSTRARPPAAPTRSGRRTRRTSGAAAASRCPTAAMRRSRSSRARAGCRRSCAGSGSRKPRPNGSRR